MSIKYTDSFQVTVPNGAATPTAGIDLKNQEVVGIVTPAALTSTTISFTAADTLAGPYLPVYKEDGTLYSITVAANRRTRVDPAVLKGIRFLKIVTGSNEAAQRSIQVCTRNPNS